ncbi:hypothetical protein OUZ56_004712 [Daphnia magna]|uniref:Uncharacterized protein n=2 Tax=Daphnia magna TaxID=35525 RepID=A0ABQ9YQT5_9CRUS|nr:hypothetical protein OUZ56_004712 [Daphnia magna]
MKHAAKQKEILWRKLSEKRKEKWNAKLKKVMEANTNDEFTSILQKISLAEEIPLNWSHYTIHKFKKYLNHIMMVKQVNPKIVSPLWFLMTNRKEKERKDIKELQNKIEENLKARWTTTIKNVIEANINEDLMNSLKKIGSASDSFRVRHGCAVDKIQFDNFLKNIPGYQVNSVIDEQLRILISKASNDLYFKQKNEKLLSKGLAPIPYEECKKWASFVTTLIDNGKLVSDAEEKIFAHGDIPKKWKHVGKPSFKNFLKNKLSYEVNSEIADNLWDIIAKQKLALREKRTKVTEENKVIHKEKQEKMNSDIDNVKPIVSAGSAKRFKKNVELKTPEDVQEKGAVKVKKVAAIQKAPVKTKAKKRNIDIDNTKPVVNGSNSKKMKKNVELKAHEDVQGKRVVKVKKVTLQKGAEKIKVENQENDIDNTKPVVNGSSTEMIMKDVKLEPQEDVQEKRAVKGKKVAIQRGPEKPKEKKRKSDIDNTKPSVNGSNKKRIEKNVELKTQEDETRNPLSETITVSKLKSRPSKSVGNKIGKTKLRAAVNKKLPFN